MRMFHPHSGSAGRRLRRERASRKLPDAVVPPEKCDAAWSMASPDGDTIAKGAAVPIVLDFTMVDSNADGAIDKDEFNKACSAGMVKADEATVSSMEVAIVAKLESDPFRLKRIRSF